MTFQLARVITNSTQDTRKRHSLENDIQCLVELSCCSKRDVSVDVDAGRTTSPARAFPFFVNNKGIRICLWIGTENTLPTAYRCIKFTLHRNRANLNTFPASGALVHINKSSALPNSYLEMPCRSRDLFQFRPGNRLNVQMPAALHEFGRKNAHRTIISGKCLVQTCHVAANGR